MGCVNVDAMLDSLSPEQFNEWYAEHLLEPFGDEWLMAGTIAVAAHNAGLLTAMAMSGTDLSKDFLQPTDFIPTIQDGTKPAPKKFLSDSEMEHSLRMMFPG